MGIQQILKSKRKAILSLAAKHGACNVRVFGSVARGEARPASDVDFLVEFKKNRSLFDHIGLIQDLEDLLKRKVDVVEDRLVHWYIRDRVFREAVPL